MICEKIITNTGEQNIMVAASPTGNLANPTKIQVTVRHPTTPEIRYDIYVVMTHRGKRYVVRVGKNP